MLAVEPSGRHRYYRIASAEVAAAVEALAVVAPPLPVRSLRDSTRAAAMRRARTCYDHLAGKLGVAVTEALVRRGALERTDGVHGVDRAANDPLAAPLPVHPYRLGANATGVFGALGVDLGTVDPGRRAMLRFCVDWSEQRHHLAGALGAAVLARFESARWLDRTATRAVKLTRTGESVLSDVLGVGA